MTRPLPLSIIAGLVSVSASGAAVATASSPLMVRRSLLDLVQHDEPPPSPAAAHRADAPDADDKPGLPTLYSRLVDPDRLQPCPFVATAVQRSTIFAPIAGYAPVLARLAHRIR